MVVILTDRILILDVSTGVGADFDVNYSHIASNRWLSRFIGLVSRAYLDLGMRWRIALTAIGSMAWYLELPTHSAPRNPR
jgi:hypothetical protein